MSTIDRENDEPKTENSTNPKDGKPADMSYYRDSLQNPIMDEDTLQKKLMSITVSPLESQNEPEEKQESQCTETDEKVDKEGNNKVKIFNKFAETLHKTGQVTSIMLILLMFFGVGLSGAVISSSLYQAMKETDDQFLPVIVVLKEQSDVDKLYMEARNLGRDERRAFVMNRLISYAIDSQADLRTKLEQLEQAGLVSDLRFLWITNVIGMKATKEGINSLAGHPDIERIEYDPLRQLIPSHPIDIDFSTERKSPNKGTKNDREITPNVSLINAPQVWEQGFEGSGVVVGVVDTGVNYNHTDLSGRLWTHPNYPNHGYNFFSNNFDTLDGHGHGTHCAGIIAGNGASGIHTGVAPQSKIMVLRVTDANGQGSQQNVWNAVQFAIQNGADILSISMGWQYSWYPDRSMWRNVMTNALSAGISSAVAIGNEGNAGLRTPGDCPPPWRHPDQTLVGGYSGVVSVGATNNLDQAASFSSRGPAAWHLISPYFDYSLNPGIGLIRPDLVAPGVDIVSLSTAYDNISYATMSGTSQATPAVAGVMALMYSKKPLSSPEEISQHLEQSTLQLSTVKNNITGSGRVDALAALNNLAAYISIHGYTIDGINSSYAHSGQTINLGINLINYGIYDVENINAVITSTDPYVTIHSNSVFYGDIDGLEMALPSNTFVLSFASNTPHNHRVQLVLDLSASGDVVWEQEMFIDVQAPQLELLFPIVSDPLPGGNGNGIAEAGETLELYFPIINSGGFPIQEFSVQIQSLDNLATINHVSNTHYTSLPTDEILYPYLNLCINNQVVTGDEIRFSYAIQGVYHEFSGVFSVFVGGVNNIQVGAGNLINSPSEASPINIHYRSLRGQAVYTLAELHQAGYVSQGGAIIRGMAYYVEAAPLHPLPNFTIRMKHTIATDISQHDDGPFETVHSMATFLPTAGNWNFITFDTPFNYNGVDNILVDTAFSQTVAFSSSGQLRINTVPNGYRFVRADNANQSNAPTTHISSNKPQIAFQMIPNPPHYGDISLTAVHTGTEVALEWETTLADAMNLIGYAIYRNGILLQNVGIEQLSYTDVSVLPATWYYYFIQGIIDDDESFASNIIGVQTQNAIPMPLIDPVQPIQYSSILISISTDTQGATIRYTTDGTDPNESSTLYSEPFSTDCYQTLVKARAYKANHFSSLIAESQFFILRPPVEMALESNPGSVSITWQPPVYDGARTMNRSRTIVSVQREHTKHSLSREVPLGYNLYRSGDGITFDRVNADIITGISFDDEGLPSGEFFYYVTAVYEPGESEESNIVSEMVTGILPAPEFDPAPGEYYEPITVFIQSEVTDTDVYYTIDGSDPDSSAILYEGSGISINGTTMIRAIAMHTNWHNSRINSALYTIETSNSEDYVTLPLKTELIKAYPNPFNPISNLMFGISNPMQVKLEVFSLRGQLVRSLIDKRMSPGYHTIIWDGTDNGNKPVGSGVYLYKLTADRTSQIMKILMIK